MAHEQAPAAMKHVTSSRRQVVMAALLGLAVVGAAMRHWAGNPSLARDIGTLLLVLWLPAVGNLVAFAVRQWHARTRRRTGFDGDRAFLPQLVVRLTRLEPQGSPGAAPPTAPDPRHCTIAFGSEGFTARTALPLAQILAEAAPQEVPLELLRPGLALARLAPGTPFQLLVGNTAVARGSVLRHCP
jgi:hypothetical protein